MNEIKILGNKAEVLDHIPIGIFVLREDCVLLYWNRCLEDWTGMAKEQVIGIPIGELFPHLTSPKYLSRFQDIFNGGPPTVFSSHFHKSLIPLRRREGQPAIQHTTVTSIPTENPGKFHALFSIQDVTDLTHRIQEYRIMHDKALREIEERQRVEERLHQREKQQRVATQIGRLFLQTGDLQKVMNRSVRLIAKVLGVELCKILLLDKSGEFLKIAAGIGWKEGVVGKATVPTNKESQAGYTLMVNGPVVVDDLGKEVRFNDPPLLHQHGVVSGLSVPMVSRGRSIGVLGVHSAEHHFFSADEIEFLQNVSNLIAVAIERKRAEESLAEQAIRDSLTNLFNRRHFRVRFEEEILRAKRNKEPFGILLCDLDHFKSINDSKGHHFGDDVLKSISRSIQDSTRGTDLVFRWGGDEFVIILSKITRAGIFAAVDRIHKGVRKIGEGMGLKLDMTIGVALFPEHGATEDELVRLADRALYIAKKQNSKMHIGVEDYKLNENSIKVVFQPVVDIRSNQVLGYEALCRDPQGKLSVPELFKKYNAIGKLNELKQICLVSQIKIAQKMGLNRVFINIDFEVLGKVDPLPKKREMQIILEISELEALKDLENRLSLAAKWRDRGYQFAIDDFGAGFISLPFIARLIPEYIKIDRSTILQAVSSERFKGFLNPLLQALRGYVSEGIIAEGVELEKELKIVKEMGIFLVQGFLFGKPEELH